MNIRQTKAHADFLRSIGWQIEKKKIRGKMVYVFIRHFPLIPVSVMKIQRLQYEELDWEWLELIEKKHRVVETLIELEGLTKTYPPIELGLLKRGYKPVKDFMLTTKTRVIDLGLTEEKLLADMKSKTRYNIGLAERRGLKVRFWTGKEVVADKLLYQSIYQILKDNARRIGMYLLPANWIRSQLEFFGRDAWVLGVVDNDERLVAVALYYCSKTSCFYSHNGSTEVGRRLMAPSLALWSAIKEAKQRNLADFDFDGVYDERCPKKRWLGFTRFKAGFGGEELYFPPMYAKWRWPF